MIYEEQYGKEMGRKFSVQLGMFSVIPFIKWLESKLSQSEERIRELESQIITLESEKK
jgi:hypothetical protein